MDDRQQPPQREYVSKDELDRRIQAAAWDEMDRVPHPATQFLVGGFFSVHGRDRRLQSTDMKVDELEAKLRERERTREERLYRPRETRWWHSLWPFR